MNQSSPPDERKVVKMSAEEAINEVEFKYNPKHPYARKQKRICELLGWKGIQKSNLLRRYVGNPPDAPTTFRVLPDISLDLLHEAEKLLTTRGQWSVYIGHLEALTDNCVHATAEQRYEALLKTTEAPL